MTADLKICFVQLFMDTTLGVWHESSSHLCNDLMVSLLITRVVPDEITPELVAIDITKDAHPNDAD